jgi:signal transduction histidine kinase
MLKSISSLATSVRLPALTAVSVVAIFLADTFTPEEIAFQLLYGVVVVLSGLFWDARKVRAVAVGCIALSAVSYFVSIHFVFAPHTDPIPGIANELIAIGGILLTSIFVIKDQHAKAEISKLNDELARKAAELEVSNKELEAFSYSVAHDLRAPLRHIIGYCELLQKQSAALDDKGQRYARTILESANKMGDLIDDLLAFSRIGRAEARMTLVSLDRIVREVVAEAGQEAKGRNIGWKIGPLPVCYADPAMLRLVIFNLVSNAVKFTRERERAEIEIGATNNSANEVEMFVKDNGAGFDMRYENKLFGVFQRLHLAEQFEGTGIGLAIVRRIIHRHGGQVRAEGQIDHGATFYFSLPATQKAHNVAQSTMEAS